jgi:hypothetical protein
MTKIRDAVCPSCGSEVSVTYWPYNVPLYTVHLVRGSNRDCRQSLRPVVAPQDTPPPRPAGG